jgi:acyl-CoA thioesterase
VQAPWTRAYRGPVPALDRALTLRPAGQDRWLAHADPDHESLSAMFGGWTAATVLRAVVQSADEPAPPSAMTVNFLGAITPGDDVLVETHHLGGGRSINHWQADLRTIEGSVVLASALVVLAARRDTDAHCQLTMPEAPDPETLEEFHSPGPQGQQTIIRPVSGEIASGDTSSCHWLREAAGRPLDHLQLAYFADQCAPRSFYWGQGLRPSATITMSVYFHATGTEIAAAGDDYVLLEACGTRGEQSTSGQQARLWSRQGDLLATTQQLCWYR